MRFRRNVHILHSQLDAAPLATVFFLLVIFVLLGSLVYTPGVRMQIELPRADGFSGVAGPTLEVAVDAGGQYYFENQLIPEKDLGQRLKAAATDAPAALTLVVFADKAVRHEILERLATLASDAGIYDLLLAVLPRSSPGWPGPP
jgi:biopolymer transport protein ExbD